MSLKFSKILAYDNIKVNNHCLRLTDLGKNFIPLKNAFKSYLPKRGGGIKTFKERGSQEGGGG